MNGTVTKSELIERISEQLKLPAGKAEQIVNTMLRIAPFAPRIGCPSCRGTSE